MKKNMISLTFMVPGCRLCFIWLLPHVSSSSLAMKWSRVVKGLVALPALCIDSMPPLLTEIASLGQ